MPGSGTTNFFVPTRLMTAPTKRAAYSDRTAWIMASLSELAYKMFETDELGSLEESLSAGGFDLIQTVNAVHGKAVDTQAILVNKPGVMTVLAFRGTEFKGDRREKAKAGRGISITDIRTDLDARFADSGDATGGRLSRGFLHAYEAAHDAAIADGGETIRTGLEKLKEAGLSDPLYITGHSLGAPLATVAARELEKSLQTDFSDLTVAACYTFCSPRVGDGKWVKGIKVPIYRVVNGCDGVPLVPFSDFLFILIRKIPILGWGIKNPIFGFVGYQHAGAFKYLVGSEDKPKTVDLLQGSAATWRRFFRVAWAMFTAVRYLALRQLTAFARDHSISRVVAKLLIYAERRNP